MANENRIYLDHAATTPTDPRVIVAMEPYFSAYNPSSVHAEGRAAHAALDSARDRVAELLNAKRNEIIFTSSGSESNAMAILGAARASIKRHIVSTAIEHHAVLHALDALRDEGFEITLLGVNAEGRVSAEEFAQALRPDTVLASVMYANNEIGSVQPVAELAKIAREHGVLFHTDAVQTPGYLPLDMRALGVDLLSLSAHKFYGPKGVGLLYVRSGVALQPLVYGGSQEFGKRAGTENVAGIVGLASALELALDDWENTAAEIGARRDKLEHALMRAIPGAWIYGSSIDRLPNIISLGVPGIGSEQALIALDLAGIAVSSGSACTSGVVEASHVIGALPGYGQGAVVRLSLGRATTDEDIERACELVPGAVRGGQNGEYRA
jgi:cysteine desulfurase